MDFWCIRTFHFKLNRYDILLQYTIIVQVMNFVIVLNNALYKWLL